MNVKQGDKARIVGGVLHPSPNHGKIVVVSAFQGEHTMYGPIWRVVSEQGDLVTEYGVCGLSLDCADDWLEKLPDQEIVEQQLIEEKLVA